MEKDNLFSYERKMHKGKILRPFFIDTLRKITKSLSSKANYGKKKL